jgi:hypothetical protein
MCNNTLLNFDPSMTACDGKVGEVRRVCLSAAVQSCARLVVGEFDSLQSVGAGGGQEKCESVCKDAGDVCTCTLDRVGSTCARWRPYTCSFRLLSPTPNCKPIPGVRTHRTRCVDFGRLTGFSWLGAW